ncbi:hypothetical protein B9T33_07610 [Acinetobacter sp. ANC 5054]|uniref:DUF1543 domain-containing protein n=1 Tax=Acinetobacter sp. ANC 5054 TaxID=1977877 RepID=UPI000A346B25|nr:DUF1543 domain-containing protein [Acinetobacter sp. ANC 5054]OTG80837.1 hypothetical protein B9T33_07610 [Acinetobacter sp. ANC 5054]
MSSLFVVMLGGRHARANVEVHDVILTVGDTLTEVYPQLRNAWFGEQKGLHIDAWAQIQTVGTEGQHYQIQFTDAAPNASDEKLWLINLGGYDPRDFGELHRYILVTGQNAMVAKQRGKAYFASQWQKQHTDRVLDVDDCIAIDHVHGRYVQLVATETVVQNRWENDYLLINEQLR